EGGFGITYLADNTELQRTVALKELLPVDIAFRTASGEVAARNEENDGEMEWARQRFMDEARNIARCVHASIITGYEVLEANGTAYMATSYEPGSNLETWLKRRKDAPLTEEDVRGIIEPILSGLQTVHKHSLLHRDIKPENLYVCDDRSRPLLLDFGAA